MGKSLEELTAPPREPRLQEPGWEGGRRPAGSALRPAWRWWLLLLAAMKRPCEETTSESDMDETIDVGSENNYSG